MNNGTQLSNRLSNGPVVLGVHCVLIVLSVFFLTGCSNTTPLAHTDADTDTDTDTDTDSDLTGSCPVFVNGDMLDDDSHDGSSWSLAFSSVQAGIDAAAALVQSAPLDTCEVWITTGTYTPTKDIAGDADPGDPRTKTFLLRAGVSLYGGFCGDELYREARDVSSNPTILSGDMGVADDNWDNAYHVVTGSTGASMDGFTIIGGMAADNGGGMYNFDSSPTVTNCVFTNNIALFGGGMYNAHSSPTVTNCVFSDNIARFGGGMYNSDSDPKVTGCSFEGNLATLGPYPNYSKGGGMYNVTSSPAVTGCVFKGNSADYLGGGLHNNTSSPIVTNCTFEANLAEFGGGIANFYNSEPVTANCLFSRDANHSIFNDYSAPVATNCTFLGAAGNFGGVYNNNGAAPTFTNCVLWGRDGMFTRDTWSYASPILTYSNVEGGCNVDAGCTADATGNIDEEPLFVNDDADAGVLNLRLQAGSPCIDTGSTDALPADTADLDDDGDELENLPFDLDNNPRVVGISVDMGAYEY